MSYDAWKTRAPEWPWVEDEPEMAACGRICPQDGSMCWHPCDVTACEAIVAALRSESAEAPNAEAKAS